MAIGRHLRRRFDGRDLDPHTGSPRFAQFQEYRQRVAAGERFGVGSEMAGEVETMVVVQPDGTQAYIVQTTEDASITYSIPTNGDYQFTPGQRATVANTRAGALIIGSPVAGERSKSGRSTARVTGQLDYLDILSADPFDIEEGSTVSVTFTGAGFRESPVDTLVAVVKTPELPQSEWLEDGDITVSSVVWVDSETITANVTAAAGTAKKMISYRVTRS